MVGVELLGYLFPTDTHPTIRTNEHAIVMREDVSAQDHAYPLSKRPHPPRGVISHGTLEFIARTNDERQLRLSPPRPPRQAIDMTQAGGWVVYKTWP